MLHRQAKKIYGEDYMKKVPATMRETLSLPDRHNEFAKPKAERDKGNH
jgi:hypothetical protein